MTRLTLAPPAAPMPTLEPAADLCVSAPTTSVVVGGGGDGFVVVGCGTWPWLAATVTAAAIVPAVAGPSRAAAASGSASSAGGGGLRGSVPRAGGLMGMSSKLAGAVLAMPDITLSKLV